MLSLTVILRGRPLRSLSTIVPRSLISPILYLTVPTEIFVIRAVVPEDRWLLFE
jgi:hypothetical protein